MNLHPVRRDTEAEDSPRPKSEAPNAFALNVFSVLERTEYRRIDTGEDIESIYRLRYKSYRAAGMVSDIPGHMVHDELDDQPNCRRFGVYIDGLLVSTLRIHHATQAHPISPSFTVYGDVLMPRLAAGDTFVDPSRFAADPEWSHVYPQIPYLTLRLAGMACFHFDAPYCLSTIKEEHAGFYRRIYSSEQIGPKRDYPGLNYPVVLYQANVHAIEERSFARFPFFKSTALERRLLFGQPHMGDVGSLTVLPTARYFKTAA